MNSTRPDVAFLVQLAAALTVLGLAVGCQGEQTEGSPDAVPEAERQDAATEVEQALRDADWNRRLEAAWGLTERRDVAAPTKVRLLLDALEREIGDPTVAASPHGTYLSTSEWIRFVYTRALGESDSAGLETLRTAAQEESGEKRARAILALGYAGEAAVTPQLLELLRTSAVGDVRSDAAYLLGELRAQEAIPDLRQALVADAYVVAVESLAGGWSDMYPVRVQAMRALKQLGLVLELTDDGQYRVIER